MATYKEIADDLRRDILAGRYEVGDTIPKITELAERYDAAYQTVHSAITQLEQEGLVVAVRRKGTVVRAHPDRTSRIVRGRQVERDELGYYSGPEVQHWRAVPHPDGEKTRVTTAPVPMDIADVLGVEVGTELTVRRRIVGDPRNEEHRQLADSWLSP